MRRSANLSAFILALAVACQNLQSSSALVVNKDGGYDVILAIGSDEPVPANVTEYTNNIKSVFSTLSSQMWIATRESFYISSLEIVLPSRWEVATSGNTTLSYATADVRISSSITFPYVQNQNPCGLPGDFIELPKTFFDSAVSGILGENWKVLLVSWARYRWGAYEEHGAPGDLRFPYFTRDFEAEEDEPKWVPNGCTNAEENKLVGEYRKLNGTLCDPTSEAELDIECRLFPDKGANAEVTSSLMYFHFMESITQFCDSETHQKHVPTKQNVYCDNKSVMETIESSPDFEAVETTAEYVPTLKTKISTVAATPALYVLLDASVAEETDERLAVKVLAEFEKFFASLDSLANEEIIVGVGQFPGKESGQFFEHLVPFGFLRDNMDNVLQAINERTVVNTSNHDFGIALQQAAATIRATSPSEGGNILFLKTSGASNASTFSTEKATELVLRQENIRLYAVEIVDTNMTKQNLENIALATEGDAIAISLNEESNVSDIISTWLSSKLLAEYADLPDTSPLERVSYTSSVLPSTLYTIPLLEGTQNVTFVMTVSEKIDPTNIEAGLITLEDNILAEFTENMEWGRNRYVYAANLEIDEEDFLEVQFRYSGSTSGQLIVLADGEDLPDDISVEVYTSALENTVDLSNVSNPDAPLVITALIKQNSQPVFGANVVATIQLGDEFVQDILLLDSIPSLDNPNGDGSYSEIVILPQDGNYLVTVTVTRGNASDDTSNRPLISSRIVPPDQKFISLEPVPFPAGTTKVVVLGSNIRVINADKYVPSIQTIRDLGAVASPNNTEVLFTFTAPRILNSANSSSPSVYRFYVSEDQDLLLALDITSLPGGVREAFKTDVYPTPGSVVYVVYGAVRDVPTYFAVVGFNGETTSPVSNIARVAEAETEPTTEENSSNGPIETTSETDSTSTPDVTTSEDGTTNESNETTSGTETTDDTTTTMEDTTTTMDDTTTTMEDTTTNIDDTTTTMDDTTTTMDDTTTTMDDTTTTMNITTTTMDDKTTTMDDTTTNIDDTTTTMDDTTTTMDDTTTNIDDTTTTMDDTTTNIDDTTTTMDDTTTNIDDTTTTMDDTTITMNITTTTMDDTITTMDDTTTAMDDTTTTMDDTTTPMDDTSFAPEPDEDDTTPWIQTTAGIVTIVAIVVVSITAIAGASVFAIRRRKCGTFSLPLYEPFSDTRSQ